MQGMGALPQHSCFYCSQHGLQLNALYCPCVLCPLCKQVWRAVLCYAVPCHAALCCAVLCWFHIFSSLSLLQVDIAGLDARMVALAQQQGQLQAALDRKQSLSEQLTEVSAGALPLSVHCY